MTQSHTTIFDTVCPQCDLHVLIWDVRTICQVPTITIRVYTHNSGAIDQDFDPNDPSLETKIEAWLVDNEKKLQFNDSNVRFANRPKGCTKNLAKTLVATIRNHFNQQEKKK